MWGPAFCTYISTALHSSNKVAHITSVEGDHYAQTVIALTNEFVGRRTVMRDESTIAMSHASDELIPELLDFKFPIADIRIVAQY